ncbi:MAG: ATP-binding protein [Thermodesulfobacteriota bacterium]
MAGDVDLDALRGFIDESNDSMQTIEADFIELESDPSSPEIINRIFRPVHSLKGNSGFFGLTNINKFSHRLENLLDAARKGELVVSREIIDVLLAGIDYLRKMLDRAAADPSDTALRPEEQEFLTTLERYKPQEMAGSIQSVLDLENLLHSYLDQGLTLQESSLIANLLGQIAKANDGIRKLLAERAKPAEKSAFSPDLLYLHEGRDYTEQLCPFGQVFESLAAGKAVEAKTLDHFAASLQTVATLFKGRAELAKEIDELTSLRNFMDDELMAANGEFTTSARRLLNRIMTAFERRHKSGDSQKLGEILMEQGLVSKEQIDAALGKQKKIGELLVEEGSLAKEDLEKALTIQNKRVLDSHLKQCTPAAEGMKTIRIDQDKLDSFANSVGELFIGLDSVNYVRKLLEEAQTDFATLARFDSAVATLDERVDRLHNNIMSIRRVPVKNLFQRFPRVIRQLAASLGKNIKFTMAGEETVIDKDLLETIENPLVHILRNSVDHGLELPAERKTGGKPDEGLLTLTASSDENNVYITIEDDGHGIDPQKMKEVAVRKGFLTRQQAEQLSESELVNLIFKPGFSSAEKVSDVSGRGVGMDVVMAGLRASNGSILVDSTVGRGTTVRLTIPLTKTLVTKDAMIAEAGDQKYVIPSDDITTVIETDNIIPLLAQDDCIAYDGAILRLIDLHHFFYPGPAEPHHRQERQVIVVCAHHQIALRVDHIISHQKVVAKDFAAGYRRLRNIEGVGGYTILGNEEIILIVDVKRVAEQG